MIEFNGDFYRASEIEAIELDYSWFFFCAQRTLTVHLKSGPAITHWYDNDDEAEADAELLARKIKEESLFPTH